MKKLRRQMVSGVLVLSLLATMLPISALAAEDIELPVEAESLVLEESLQQDSTEEQIQTSAEAGTDSPHIISETEIAYPVEGGNIYFDTATGAITDCDEDVTFVDIPSEIDGVPVTSIGNRAFYCSYSLTSVEIPDSVTSIGDRAFGSSGLTSVIIPDSVTSIGVYVFSNCDDLIRATIGDGLSSVANRMFYSCERLTSVIIGKRVTYLERFEDCFNLKDINVVSQNPVYCSLDGVLFNKEMTTIIEYPSGRQGAYSIPNGVLTIGNLSFYHCYRLTSVEIPDSVTSIGDDAFDGCTNLTSVKIPDSVTTIGDEAFYCCNNLTSVKIPDSVTSIGERAFHSCNSLTSVNIPDSVTSIGEGVFRSCGSLSSVEIPDGVTTIGDEAFYCCNNLTSVKIPDGVIYIGDEAFYSCGSLSSVEIPDSVTSIGESAFRSCNSLTSVIIGKCMSFTYIGRNAFLDCNSLANVYYGGSEEEWDAIFIESGNLDLTSGATIHYNSTGPDDPGIDQPDTSMGSVSFLSKWDSNTRQAYFDYSALAYSVTDDTEISPNQSIDQLVGKYVLVKTNESSPLEISSIKPVDSQIGTVTNVIFGNGNPAVTSLQFEDGTYAVVNGLIVSEDIIGKQVLYHLSSEEIVGYTELQEKTGTLEEWDSDSGQLVIDGVTYFTNYMTDEILFTIADQLIGKRVEMLCQEGVIASYIFRIAEAKEDYHIQIYASTPNLSTNINGTIDITCSLYRDDKLVEDWVEPAFVIGNDKVISTSDYILKDGSYSFTITGLSEGRSSFTVSDSYSGAYITVDISVGKALSRAYSYRMDDVPSFVPNVYGESVLTNFYNLNDLYVNKFSYTETGDGGYDVSFNIYNQGYMYGAVDVYDKDGKWIQSEKIDKFSDISSLWDTGEAIYYLIADSLDGRLLSYTSGVLSKETPISVHVPKDGYLIISNNFAESPGAFLYNTVDYLMLSVNTMIDVSVNGVQTSQIADDIVDKAIKDIDFQQEFMDKFNKIAMNVSQTSLEFGFGEAAETITVDAEDLLDSIGLNWKSSAENVVGGLESVFSKLTGPIGAVLDGSFAFTNLTSYVVQTNDICYSTNAPSILIHVPVSTSNTSTVQGVTVTTGDDVIDSEAVLQVFRISDTDAIEIVGGEIPVEEYKLYNICFVKNEEEVKPNGRVTVKIPIPSGYDKNRCVVYRQESDGSWAILQAVVEGNYLVFETDHFSLYAIADASRVSSIPVTGVELNTSRAELNQLGDTYQLKADVKPADATNQTVIWKSSNPSVATVTNDGLVTAVSEGTSTVTATTEDGQKTAMCTVTVQVKSSSNGSGGGGTNGSATSISHTITTEKTEGGIIKINHKTASKGRTVTITAMPDDGFMLDTLSVSDKKGNEIKITKETDTSYTFKMPASKVTVSATFASVIPESEPVILPFDDVLQTSWYYDAVEYVYLNHLMRGTSKKMFSPKTDMSRAMIATVLYRLENKSALAGCTAFSDVASNEWYTDAIYWAAENNIINGYGNNQFGPMDNVTREQLAVILSNYARYKGIPIDTNGNLLTFSDIQDTSVWAKEAISWANGVGILSGKGNNILDPKGFTTRAEVAQILMNYHTKVIG